MSSQVNAGRIRSIYEFIKTNRHQYSVQMMCRLLGVAPSGYYEWLKQPLSKVSGETGEDQVGWGADSKAG